MRPLREIVKMILWIWMKQIGMKTDMQTINIGKRERLSVYSHEKNYQRKKLQYEV